MSRAVAFTWLVAFLSAAVAIVSYRYLLIGFGEAFGGIGSYRRGYESLLAVHVAASPIALALGAVQFFPGIRKVRLSVHRWTGRIYLGAVALGGISGLMISGAVPGGIISGVGFGLLATLWLATTGFAFFHIRARRIDLHRQWMIRSFSLTLAAVTLRIYLPLLVSNGWTYDAAAPLLAWLCWVPNLAIADLYLRRATSTG